MIFYYFFFIILFTLTGLYYSYKQGPNWSFKEIAKRLNEENKNGSGTGVGLVLNGSGMGVRVNLPGVGWDKIFLMLAWDWDGTRHFSVGEGWDRRENTLLCHPLVFMCTHEGGNV
ncbi:hypothetical protein ATANTOWER_020221 [Ataeniobius toweri]|uniref:Uncharacterized protein n=1 Tax=Ataeniobius toweri TaxID=208326 RepID=A0ABU7BTU7_9TELE|nr:hypothetical protein [Ataeniobius toweri]